jgi:putative phosphoesterase
MHYACLGLLRRKVALADIHGNLRALEAVQDDLRRHSPDVVVNLGDHLSGPLQAAATADALMSEKYVHIRGNHDRQLLDRPIEEMGASDSAAYAQLESRHKVWLRSLPSVLEIERDILLCHGSPDDDLQYLTEEVMKNGVVLASAEKITERLGDLRRKLVLCGHSHIPRVVSISRGVQIVNPGSVGLQAYDDTRPRPHYMETGSPHARYAVIDREGGSWRINLLAVEYDWSAASEDARKGNRPDWAHALETGYAMK